MMREAVRVCRYACMYECLCACACMYVCLCVYASMYVYMYVNVWVVRLPVSSVSNCNDARGRACIYVCIYVCFCVCIHTYDVSIIHKIS
jgi:hypothetical protein